MKAEKSEVSTTDFSDFRRFFDYSPEEGKIFWRISKGSVRKGKEAGTIVSGGHKRVLLNGKTYAVHSVVWYFEYGAYPEQLDHRDRNKTNNKIGNLRLADHSQNAQNKPIQCNNNSGTKGVHFCSTRNKWVAQLRMKGKKSIQKSFTTMEEAVSFRKSKEKEFYGEFYLPE